ncbi:hypothetical protein BD410DRAFT_203227 [Rickenella mellea]|uniref:Fungal-type protein kinase domain-containing protein n=1 Tax=Rickenella mellea TaxID=50990 RepID=A0A4Y7Q5E1_9AGAM|nr:hypothetical protein BD410DRAFT_203227 [Rickenella mellea]
MYMQPVPPVIPPDIYLDVPTHATDPMDRRLDFAKCLTSLKPSSDQMQYITPLNVQITNRPPGFQKLLEESRSRSACDLIIYTSALPVGTLNLSTGVSESQRRRQVFVSAGILADLDLCITHCGLDRKAQPQRTGTVAFMATHLFADDTAYPNPIHLPVFDIESAMWAFVWSFVRKVVEVCGDTPHYSDKRLCKELSVTNIDMTSVFGRRFTTTRHIERLLGPNFGSCRIVVSKAFRLVKDYDVRSAELADRESTFSNEEIGDAFSQYLEVFESNMPSESDWSYVKGQPQVS